MNRGTQPEGVAPKFRRGLKTSLKEEQGQNLVEFALVIILALLMIFGIIDFARALYTYHFVAHAAREGSRYASVRGADCHLQNCAVSDIQDYVKSLSNGIGLDQSAMANPQVAWSQGNTADPACVSDHNPGCVVQVQVTYNFKFIFPLLPTGVYPMTSTSQMVTSQ